MRHPSSIRVASHWLQAARLDALKPNDRLKVFHGTRLAEVFALINGFDANKVHYRHYGGQKHAGLFVSPSEALAERFSDRGVIILEIETKAKHLHGTDYSGNIGREQDMNERTRQWMRDEYPDSFRPYLSMTMLQSSEPQALLRGLVRPNQIKRVRFKDHGGSPKWYSRKAFLDLGLELVPAKDQPYGRKRKLRDLGYDLSYPGYSIKEFFAAATELVGMSEDRVIKTFHRMWETDQRRGVKTVEELLEQIGFEPTAVKAYVKKLGDYWSQQKVASRWIESRSEFNPAHYGLEGLLEGKPVKLYHGTTANFKNFDLSKSRPELVNAFYGKGIFLTPSKRVAWKYAEANRNIGFDPSIIDDLKRKNPNAGAFLGSLHKNGWPEAWDLEYARLEKEGLAPGQTAGEALDEYLGDADGNLLTDIAGYILGSKTKLQDSSSGMLFSTSTGAPEWLFDTLDEVGLDSSKYRPKVYTVTVRVQNPLITASQSKAKRARSQGYDSVIYHGRQLVDQVPEVAVFNPRDVSITKVEAG